LKVEDEGEEKPKGEFSLRLEEIIIIIFFKPQNPDIASLHLNSAWQKKERKKKSA
jgi:hypothetical protein